MMLIQHIKLSKNNIKSKYKISSNNTKPNSLPYKNVMIINSPFKDSLPKKHSTPQKENINFKSNLSINSSNKSNNNSPKKSMIKNFLLPTNSLHNIKPSLMTLKSTIKST